MDAFGLDRNNIKGGAYTLEGNDDFLLKTAESFFESLLPIGSLSLKIIDKLTDITEIVSSVMLCNFDGSPNVVIVRDAEAKISEDGHKMLLKLLQSPFDNNFLVLSGAPYLTPAEKKSTTVIDCSTMDKFRCVGFIEKQFPFGIDRDAAALLADNTENNLSKINNEIKKLQAYCGDRKTVLSDVENLVAEDKEIQIFSLANSIVNKNHSLAVRQLEKMRTHGISDSAILSSLSGQFQRMLYCALSPLGDEELAGILKIKPYAVKKTRENKKFNKAQLKETVFFLLDLEQSFKTGLISDETAVNIAVEKLLVGER